MAGAGSLALAEAAAFNTTLSQVDIRNNRLDADAKAAVRAVAPQALAGRLLMSSATSDAGDPEPPDARNAKGAGVAAGLKAKVKAAAPTRAVKKSASVKSLAAVPGVKPGR